MQLMNEIPDTFWSLFRSVNRDIYIEALLCINEEYEYNNYFLTKEVCIQILSDMNAKKRFELQREENDTDFDMLETPSSRILNGLLCAFQFGVASLDGLRRFLLCHGWSLLSARRHKKGRLLRFGNSRPMGQIFSLWGVVCLVVAIGRNHAQD